MTASKRPPADRESKPSGSLQQIIFIHTIFPCNLASFKYSSRLSFCHPVFIDTNTMWQLYFYLINTIVCNTKVHRVNISRGDVAFHIGAFNIPSYFLSFICPDPGDACQNLPAWQWVRRRQRNQGSHVQGGFGIRGNGSKWALFPVDLFGY